MPSASAGRLRVAIALALCLTDGARGERLPLRAYGTSDGLPSTSVLQILRDSRGLLWFATRDGLARFDGTSFVTYGTDQGLPVATVNSVAESRRGGYWVGTNGAGVCWLDPAAPRGSESRPLFRCTPSRERTPSELVNVVWEDRSGTVWAGTDDGLFRRNDDGAFAAVEMGLRDTQRRGINALAESDDGRLWIGSHQGLFERDAGGRVVRRPLLGDDDVLALWADRRGRIWVGLSRGLVVFAPEPAGSPPADLTASLAAAPRNRHTGDAAALPERAGEAKRFDVADGLPSERVLKIFAGRDGRLWAGTMAGLARLDGQRFRAFGRANGLANDTITALAEDASGNLWLANLAAVMKLVRHGFLTHDDAGGPGSEPVHSLYAGGAGEIYAVSGDWRVSRLEQGHFDSAQLAPPAKTPDWGTPAAFRDRTGGWWLLSPTGLGRLAPVHRIEELDGRSAVRQYTLEDGMPGQRVLRLFEDARGDLWIGADLPPGVAGLARWERSSGRIATLPQVHARAGDPPIAMAEDAAGGLWVGFRDGGLGRLRDGRFQLFPMAPSGPRGASITAIERDASGRLWIASNEQGLMRVEDPARDQPRFTSYTTAQGLSSNNVRCLTWDDEGRIYAGTVHGVDRLDPATGRVHQFTTSEGLPNAFVLCALREPGGRLWFGTRSGLASLTPVTEQQPPPGPVWIGAVRVGGAAQDVPHLGALEMRGIEVAPQHNHLQVEYFAVDLGAGGPLRFQHRLDEAADWSPPSVQRAVQFGSLAPGRHRLLVRALNADGLAGQPASVELRVLPTAWQRSSVRALLVLALALGLYAAHRLRLRQALAVARVRNRIASDLHDDIGANLSQISILSELAKRRAGGDPVTEPLERIASLSRESVDSMGDIVWAINPRRDSLRELSQRMRSLAGEVLGARGIRFTFRGPGESEDRRLDSELRRQVYLVFKEALNNLARHSGGAAAEIDLTVAGGSLVLTVLDDGRGLGDESGNGEGHGLQSMMTRARELGGSLEITPGEGRGLAVTLRVPLA